MVQRTRERDPYRVLAQLTIVAAVILSFDVVPLPGIVTLGLVLPGVVLAARFCSLPRTQLPWAQMLLIATFALSVLWSDDPAYSVERLRTWVPLTLSAVLAASILPSTTTERTLRTAVFAMVGISVVEMVLIPSGRTDNGSFSLHGSLDKNVFGGVLVLALLLTLSGRHRKGFTLLLVSALLVLIALNRSATAYGIALGLLVLYGCGSWIISRLGYRAGLAPLVLMSTCASAIIFLAFEFFATPILAVVGKDPSLTQRTAIWSASWEQIKHRPVLGHGAYTFLDAPSGSPVTNAIWLRFTNYLPPHPHNGLLDLWGQLGLIGVAVFALMIAVGLASAVRAASAGRREALTAVLGIVFILLFGITEPTYSGQWMIVSLLCVSIAQGAPRDRDYAPPGPRRRQPTTYRTDLPPTSRASVPVQSIR